MEAWETLAGTHGVPSHYRNREAVVRQQAAGGLFCNSSLLLEVLWLIRMQSYICTMIIAVRRRRLKVDIDGEYVVERLGETARQI